MNDLFKFSLRLCCFECRSARLCGCIPARDNTKVFKGDASISVKDSQRVRFVEKVFPSPLLIHFAEACRDRFGEWVGGWVGG